MIESTLAAGAQQFSAERGLDGLKRGVSITSCAGTRRLMCWKILSSQSDKGEAHEDGCSRWMERV